MSGLKASRCIDASLYGVTGKCGILLTQNPALSWLAHAACIFAANAVLSERSYWRAAQTLKTAIRETDGLNTAADIIDRVSYQTAVA